MMLSLRSLLCMISLYCAFFTWVMVTIFHAEHPAESASTESEFVHHRQLQLQHRITHSTIKDRLLAFHIPASDLLGDSSMHQVCNCEIRVYHSPHGGSLQCKMTCKANYDKLIVCIKETVHRCSGEALLENPARFFPPITASNSNNHTAKRRSYVLVSYESDETRVTSLFRSRDRGQIVNGHSSEQSSFRPEQCYLKGRVELVPRETNNTSNNPHAAIQAKELKRLAEEYNVKRWFVRNPIATHPMMGGGVPIGVFYPDKDQIVASRRYFSVHRPQIRHDQKLVYLNFALEGSERLCLHHLAREKWQNFATIRVFEPDADHDSKLLSKPQYHYELAQHVFAVSPRGYGLDCFRTWESLYLGVIPILLRRSPAHDDMFRGLPVLFVDSWDEITEPFLRAKLFEMQAREYDLARLQLHTLFQDIRASF